MLGSSPCPGPAQHHGWVAEVLLCALAVSPWQCHHAGASHTSRPSISLLSPVWDLPPLGKEQIHTLSRDNDFISHLRRDGCWVLSQS